MPLFSWPRTDQLLIHCNKTENKIFRILIIVVIWDKNRETFTVTGDRKIKLYNAK